MAVRELRLGAEADRILESMSELCGGDSDRAVSDLLKTRNSVEVMLCEIEAHYGAELFRLRNRSEIEFEAGQTVSWEALQ